MEPDRQAAGLVAGTILEGAYRIERLIAKGGMGAVYEAFHLRLVKRVAVKVMARELSASEEGLARFRREALVTSGLGHPHIVQVFDHSVIPTGEPFLVMEFLEGEDLDHRLHRVGRLPPAGVVHIVKQIASALAAAHAKGIVHRDLKPANICLLELAGETDFVKVLDFGISKVRLSETKLTKATIVMGTPNYMSPEQALGHVDEIDYGTDQWALACIAWECLSGEGPFRGDDVPSLLYQVVHEPPQPLAPKVPDLPPEMESVLRRALSKKKDERFPDVSTFSLALESALAGKPALAMQEERVSPPTVILPAPASEAIPAPTQKLPTTFTRNAGELVKRPAVPPSRPKWPWAVAGGAAVVLLLAGVFLLRPRAARLPASAGFASPSAPAPTPAAAEPSAKPTALPAQAEAPPLPALAEPNPVEGPTPPRPTRAEPMADKATKRSGHSKAIGSTHRDIGRKPTVAPQRPQQVDRKLIEDL